MELTGQYIIKEAASPISFLNYTAAYPIIVVIVAVIVLAVAVFLIHKDPWETEKIVTSGVAVIVVTIVGAVIAWNCIPYKETTRVTVTIRQDVPATLAPMSEKVLSLNEGKEYVPLAPDVSTKTKASTATIVCYEGNCMAGWSNDFPDSESDAEAIVKALYQQAEGNGRMLKVVPAYFETGEGQ